ncbi:MAG: ribonuclease P protein component [Clostridia bacterium]|nr:ribonuclease P protein component [Clostridia bacterium]
MLAKRNRLTKRGSFQYVYKKGAIKTDGALRLTYVCGKGTPRVGVSVPNTVGKAVRRNKVRRRIRAVMRAYVPRLRGAQLVISARSGADKLSFAQLRDMIDNLLRSSGLYAKKEDNAVARN